MGPDPPSHKIASSFTVATNYHSHCSLPRKEGLPAILPDATPFQLLPQRVPLAAVAHC